MSDFDKVVGWFLGFSVFATFTSVAIFTGVSSSNLLYVSLFCALISFVFGMFILPKYLSNTTKVV